MAEWKEQEQDLIYAMDIGTRSIVGMVGTMVDDRFKVLEIELAEHGKRYMLDGQIDDIEQVGFLARTVTKRLEERLGVRLKRVCVAAAGRALRTQSGSFALELENTESITPEQISRLEAGAVTAAEEALQIDDEARQRFFLVGYTVSQYRLDNYPLSALQYHSGKKVEADVVATFLPGEVVESLYAAMRTADLQVASMTLEPIAAINAAIPADLRLLNLALVDIGAGTTDIAICKDGSVVGYTMVTVAGDEITEAIMRTYLVDFQTAEQIKRDLCCEGEIHYVNILGLEECVTCDEVSNAIQEPMFKLADAISKQIIAINGISPSALFLSGGGSKLVGLREKVAKSLEMDEKRVALAGNNFAKSAFTDRFDLNNPEYATPLGIAVSAGMGLLNDSYVVMLNGEPAKLFRNGILTLRDILLMNGYSYSDMVGKTGRSLSVMLNGKRVALRGEPAVPAILTVNGEDAPLTTIIHAGDQINFVPARHGTSAARTLGELLGKDFNGRVLLNNQEAKLDMELDQGDVILTLEQGAEPTSELWEIAPKLIETKSESGEGKPTLPIQSKVIKEPEPVVEAQSVPVPAVKPEPIIAVAPSMESVASPAEEIQSVPVSTASKMTPPTTSVIPDPPVQQTSVQPVQSRSKPVLKSNLRKQNETERTYRVPASNVPPASAVTSIPQVHKQPKELHIHLNGMPLTLTAKENGLPYFLMDMLQYSGIDFEHLNRPVLLEVNGENCSFSYELREHDSITICCE